MVSEYIYIYIYIYKKSKKGGTKNAIINRHQFMKRRILSKPLPMFIAQWKSNDIRW